MRFPRLRALLRRPARAIPFRWRLVGLTAGALLPVALFAAAMLSRLAAGEREANRQRLVADARTLAEGVDRETIATFRALQALGGSERLERGDLDGFREDAVRVLRTQPTWHAVLLARADGHRLLDTRRAPSPPAAPPRDPRSLEEAVRTGEPVLGDVFTSPDGELLVAARLPLLHRGRVRYVLSALVPADALRDLVRVPGYGENPWIRTLVDRSGTVVARSRAPERFVGQRATPRFLAATRDRAEGVYPDMPLDGGRSYVAFVHSSHAGWTAAVVAPVEMLDGATRRSVLTIAALGVAVVLLSAGGAFLASGRFNRAIASAASSAEALARGDRPRVEAAGIAEVARLGEALERSADLLAARERERDQHLAVAEAARAEAEAASRTKDEFLAMLGHELRNPLSPIVTALELLALGGNGGTREHAVIRRQVDHLVRLVDDLLDVSRITRGKVELQPERVEVRSFVARAVEMATPLVEERSHRLTVDVPEGLAVVGDPHRLAQVIANLLTNAARYTPPRGRIEVRAALRGGRVELAVRDDGRGLAPELLSRIFEPFVQAPQGQDRPQGGLGIGLALVRSLVALHGGRVEARSDGPGKGSTFVVELPAAPRAPAAPAPPPRQAAQGGAPLRILVVDDNEDAAELLADVLAHAGHEVRVAGDGGRGLELAVRLRPDVAILDIGLPVLDGYELAIQLRRRLGDAAPVVIGVSGYGQPNDRERSAAAGFRHHFVKPADLEALLEAVAAAGRERTRAPVA
ncbi:hybrid sensor histidine kinase/response regulator [Anaeromyxobacter dehalogenans]|uniref:histidine kinase n=1 Tax=Anaeromyxobacter dehalogenans (strain 2CP-C) TaxID=290397 RepID=Q2IDR5_ANADE|nr:ATP-binding protein [Anaeromyxobacter dehalogenans]ABC82726.1 periplasmic sensor hybrid histidine kinase [Anaeromyxobacter dehalogenans 2CP-C]